MPVNNDIEMSLDHGDSITKELTENKPFFLFDERGQKIKPANPIWTKEPSQVTNDQYDGLYQSLVQYGLANNYSVRKYMRTKSIIFASSGDAVTPVDLYEKIVRNKLKRAHFIVEGTVAYKLLIYIPILETSELLDVIKSEAVKFVFYVRDRLVSDNFQLYLPSYLNFVRGILDTEYFPYGVSISSIKKSPLFEVFQRKVISNILDMIESIDESNYYKFWNVFGESIRIGILTDPNSRSRLYKLLRFESCSPGVIVSLQEYKTRMKVHQNYIYYATKFCPAVNRLLKEGYEVLFTIGAGDLTCILLLAQYEEKQFLNVFKLSADETKKMELEELEKKFKPLIARLEGAAFKDKVTKFKASLETCSLPYFSITENKDADSCYAKATEIVPELKKRFLYFINLKKNPPDQKIDEITTIMAEIVDLENRLRNFT